MENEEKRLENYLNGVKGEKNKVSKPSIEEIVGEHNGKLLREFTQKQRALPSNPGASRLLTVLTRLKTVTQIIDKPLDKLTEKDLIKLNTEMRARGMKSAPDYRKALKQFLKLTDKKGFFDLIDSDFIKSPSTKKDEEMLVDPDEFWNEKQIADYIEESKKNSLRQTAWSGLWIPSGCRPHELLALKKNQIIFENNSLTIRVAKGKTKKRTIFLKGNEASGAWVLIEPYIKNLENDEQLFPGTYQNYYKIHKRICNSIGIPKGNSQKFYIARKMALTGFYDKYGVVKGAAMAGHVPGSNSMKHYVAMTESQLKLGLARLELRECPNVSCREMNDPDKVQCGKCKSPLDKNAYSVILENAQKQKDTQIKDLEQRFENMEENLAKALKHYEPKIIAR